MDISLDKAEGRWWPRSCARYWRRLCHSPVPFLGSRYLTMTTSQAMPCSAHWACTWETACYWMARRPAAAVLRDLRVRQWPVGGHAA